MKLWEILELVLTAECDGERISLADAIVMLARAMGRIADALEDLEGRMERFGIDVNVRIIE